jgi:hypothetical protein
MTNGSAINDKEFKEFIAGYEFLDRVAKLGDQAQDPRGNSKEKADSGLREVAHETAKKYIPDYSHTDPKSLDPKFIQEAIKFGTDAAKSQSARVFYNNLEDILQNQMPESTLEKLVDFEEVIKAASEKDQKIMALRAQYNGLEDFAKEYAKGNYSPRNEQEAKAIEAHKANGAAKTESDYLKAQGYDMDIQNAGASLAAVASQIGYLDQNKTENYALIGIKDAAEQAKKIYDQETKTRNLKDAVRDTIKKLANGSREEFEKAIALTYSAYKAK